MAKLTPLTAELIALVRQHACERYKAPLPLHQRLRYLKRKTLVMDGETVKLSPVQALEFFDANVYYDVSTGRHEIANRIARKVQMTDVQFDRLQLALHRRYTRGVVKGFAYPASVLQLTDENTGWKHPVNSWVESLAKETGPWSVSACLHPRITDIILTKALDIQVSLQRRYAYRYYSGYQWQTKGF